MKRNKPLTENIPEQSYIWLMFLLLTRLTVNKEKRNFTEKRIITGIDNKDFIFSDSLNSMNSHFIERLINDKSYWNNTPPSFILSTNTLVHIIPRSWTKNCFEFNNFTKIQKKSHRIFNLKTKCIHRKLNKSNN